MKRKNYPAFHRRLAIQRNERKKDVDQKSTESILAKAAHISQVALVILAAFGYFYTVKPVYQKERLAEEVARSQAILENQRLELEKNKNILIEIQEERKTLATNLQKLRKDLARSENERREIEEATVFMTYEYYLPDGKPAKTATEVKKAVFHKNLHSFTSNLRLACGMINLFSKQKNIFPAVRYYNIGKLDEAWSEYFPFTREEVEIWKEHGRELPNYLVSSCAKQYAEEFLSNDRLSDYPQREKLKSSIEEVVSQVLKYPSSQWKEVEEPNSVITSCKKIRNEIDSAYKEELKTVEDEYADRENAWGASTREILRHNYNVSKENASNSALSKLWATEADCRSKAEALGNEVSRLVKLHFEIASK
ncbi:hypothetical protein L5M38_11515 [Shewanella sp. SM101]|uniref:hypothetical protein n=1 Tax=Shewanella sp. SM101 TaxID=2912789 RepID=UPI0021DAD4D0|nr:hypothetical protein [Shewanella sp. SM101]MCU8105162.1 hypothetical protein [Shewanella sp. SM101]